MAEIQDVAKKVLESKSVSDVQALVNDSAKRLGKKTLRGMLHVAVSGFGKGVLIAAGFVIAAMAFSAGIFAMDGGATFASGVSSGIKAALSFLTSSAGGLAALGIGGALGMAMETRQHQNDMTARIAQLEAQAHEATRLQKQVLALHQNNFVERDEAETPGVSHVAREIEKRRASLQLVKR